MDVADLVEQVEALRLKLQPQLPDMDPGDLILILQSLLRPLGTGRRFFLRRLGKDIYVP